MANKITLKRRISSVKNTKQITKAMELVSASKMRKAQESAFAVRAYREAAYDLIARMSLLGDVKTHPLFEVRTEKTKLYIVITSNGPLAGAYNTNVLRLLTQNIKNDSDKRVKNEVIMIGKKGAQFARHVPDINLVAVYTEFNDHPTENDIQPILNTILDKYKSKDVDSIKLIYTVFKSNLVQIATELDLLPAQPIEGVDQKKYTFTNFEPSIEVVLDNVTARLVEVQIWQALLESIASEHSMRMLAMKNATDNANEIIDDLTLEFNTARQASITQELAEITGGAEALKD